jgi:hypothetical protein
LDRSKIPPFEIKSHLAKQIIAILGARIDYELGINFPIIQVETPLNNALRIVVFNLLNLISLMLIHG